MHSHVPRSEFLEREVFYHGRGLGCKFHKLLGGEDAALWLRNGALNQRAENFFWRGVAALGFKNSSGSPTRSFEDQPA